ncbi:Uncharacterised protein [Vibrio cholerae]|nr:Uncharacterised protein [Vibrio cholerae]
MIFFKDLIDLWPSSVHEYHFNAKAVQQSDIADDVRKIFIGNRFSSQHNDHGFPTVGINVGR